jgi:alpha-L-rhamnosidase
VDATPLDAGFHTVMLHPVFDARLGQVDFDYDSSYGEIHSDWTINGDAAAWKVTIPPNATGWMEAGLAAKCTLDGAPLAQSKAAKAATQDGKSGFELPAGSYALQVSMR